MGHSNINDVPYGKLFPVLTLNTTKAGATIIDGFGITGNTLGLDWDGDCGGTGAAFGCWNLYLKSGGSNWESLWACLASFKEDLNACAHHWSRDIQPCRKDDLEFGHTFDACCVPAVERK